MENKLTLLGSIKVAPQPDDVWIYAIRQDDGNVTLATATEMLERPGAIQIFDGEGNEVTSTREV